MTNLYIHSSDASSVEASVRHSMRCLPQSNLVAIDDSMMKMDPEG